MNICTVSFHSCPYSQLGGDGSGGMSVYLKELTSGLAGFPDVKVDIVTRAQSPVCVEAKDISPQIRVVQLKGGPKGAVDRKDLYEYVPEFSQNLVDFIHRQRPNYDVIHSHYWLSGLAGSQVKKVYKIPLVHTYHTLGFLKRKMLDFKEHRCRENSEQHLAHTSDSIISPSAEEKKNLLKEYGLSPEKVKVVYPGVNRRLFFPVKGRVVRDELGVTADDNLILYVGRIEPLKGLMTVIQAFVLMKQNRPHLYNRMKLIIVGGGENGQELYRNKEVIRIKQEIKRKNLGDKIAFLGSVEHRQLNRYYSAADILVVPSLYESFGLVAVEALACGTPVAASRIGKMTTIIREGRNGCLFRPGDPHSLCFCLDRFFARRDSVWSRPNIRRDIIRRYSWEKTAEHTYHILSNSAGK